MYTQCPECASAFRVTAEVLKQAAGKVRCGGCGNAFNALEFLSESKPTAPPKPDVEEALPELRPDADEAPDAELPPPQAISPEQSAALLKTLDELAGEDIRLEDTGVEWRLLPDGDEDDEAAVDEVLEEAPTPVDEFVTATPTEVEAGEVFEPDDDAEILRFDDNTGLPEVFEDAAELAQSAASPAGPEPEAETPAAPEPRQTDLSLGEPDEWSALLDEAIIEPEPDPSATGPTIADELAALEDQKPDEPIPPDIDTQFDLQAEAMGIDLSGLHEELDGDDDTVSAPLDEDDVEDGTSTDETPASIDDDLMAAAFEAEQAASDALAATATGLAFDDDDDDSLAVEATASNAEDATGNADDDEPSIVDELAALADDLADDAEYADDLDETGDFPASTGELEFELEAAQAAGDEDGPADAVDDDDDELETSAAADDEALQEAADEASIAEDLALLDDGEDTDDADAAAAQDEEASDQASGEPSIAEELALLDEAGGADSEGADDDLDIPPLSEEEQTINAMIDQDLMRLAIEDDEGFASTIVLQGKAGKKRTDRDEVPEEEAAAELPVPPAAAGVETIIMEGDFARTALEQERIAAAAEKAEPILAAAADDDDSYEPPRGRTAAMIAGVVLLALTLTGQFVHQSRAELATIPAVRDAIAPVYRAIGMPITPEWDVRGWRFEATRGSTQPLASETVADEAPAEDGTDEAGDTALAPVATDPQDEVLTIYSRIGNQSNKPLPYPLISVSLTDRFEEVIGSRVLEPSEYLGGDANPSALVPPGNTFNALIALETSAADATGFKLNVCYREASGQLRCALEDFR